MRKHTGHLSQEHDPDDPLIRALSDKGITGATLTWTRSGGGYLLRCDQIEWRLLGWLHADALQAINELPVFNSKNDKNEKKQFQPQKNAGPRDRDRIQVRPKFRPVKRTGGPH